MNLISFGRLKQVFHSPVWSLLFQVYGIGIGAALTAILFRNGIKDLTSLRLQISDSLPSYKV